MCSYWEKLVTNIKKTSVIFTSNICGCLYVIENELRCQRIEPKALTFSPVQYCTISGP